MKSKILGLLAAGLLAAPIAAQAVGVVVGGKEWRQLTETVYLSRNQVATVCSSVTGACSGSLGSVSFDGWTWASNTDIQLLFEQLVKPGTTQFATAFTNYESFNDPDIDAAIGPGGFNATQVETNLEVVWGWSRSLLVTSTRTAAYNPRFIDIINNNEKDRAWLGDADLVLDGPARSRGVWLYRVVPVPEPGTLALLGLGLAGLGLSRRRKAN